jgi:hypothetical protein
MTEREVLVAEIRKLLDVQEKAARSKMSRDDILNYVERSTKIFEAFNRLLKLEGLEER